MVEHVEALGQGKWAKRSINTAAEGVRELPLSAAGS